jgi:hypothetical protein
MTKLSEGIAAELSAARVRLEEAQREWSGALLDKRAGLLSNSALAAVERALKAAREEVPRLENMLAAQIEREERQQAEAADLKRRETHRAASVLADGLCADELAARRAMQGNLDRLGLAFTSAVELARLAPGPAVHLSVDRHRVALGIWLAHAAKAAGIVIPNDATTMAPADLTRLRGDLQAEIERALGRVDATPPLAAE